MIFTAISWWSIVVFTILIALCIWYAFGWQRPAKLQEIEDLDAYYQSTYGKPPPVTPLKFLDHNNRVVDTSGKIYETLAKGTSWDFENQTSVVYSASDRPALTTANGATDNHFIAKLGEVEYNLFCPPNYKWYNDKQRCVLNPCFGVSEGKVLIDKDYVLNLITQWSTTIDGSTLNVVFDGGNAYQSVKQAQLYGTCDDGILTAVGVCNNGWDYITADCFVPPEIPSAREEKTLEGGDTVEEREEKIPITYTSEHWNWKDPPNTPVNYRPVIVKKRSFDKINIFNECGKHMSGLAEGESPAKKCAGPFLHHTEQVNPDLTALPLDKIPGETAFTNRPFFPVISDNWEHLSRYVAYLDGKELKVKLLEDPRDTFDGFFVNRGEANEVLLVHPVDRQTYLQRELNERGEEEWNLKRLPDNQRYNFKKQIKTFEEEPCLFWQTHPRESVVRKVAEGFVCCADSKAEHMIVKRTGAARLNPVPPCDLPCITAAMQYDVPLPNFRIDDDTMCVANLEENTIAPQNVPVPQNSTWLGLLNHTAKRGREGRAIDEDMIRSECNPGDFYFGSRYPGFLTTCDPGNPVIFCPTNMLDPTTNTCIEF